MHAVTCKKSHCKQTTLSTGLSTHPFYVYVDSGRVGEGHFYVQPVSPQPKHGNTPYLIPSIKTIEGNVYAIADLSKRDNTIAYQKIIK